MIQFADHKLIDLETGGVLAEIVTATLRLCLSTPHRTFRGLKMADDGMILIDRSNDDLPGLKVFNDNGKIIVLINSHSHHPTFDRRLITALTAFYLHMSESPTDKHISDSDVEVITERVMNAYAHISEFSAYLMYSPGTVTVDHLGLNYLISL